MGAAWHSSRLHQQPVSASGPTNPPAQSARPGEPPAPAARPLCWCLCPLQTRCAAAPPHGCRGGLDPSFITQHWPTYFATKFAGLTCAPANSLQNRTPALPHPLPLIEQPLILLQAPSTHLRERCSADSWRSTRCRSSPARLPPDRFTLLPASRASSSAICSSMFSTAARHGGQPLLSLKRVAKAQSVPGTARCGHPTHLASSASLLIICNAFRPRHSPAQTAHAPPRVKRVPVFSCFSDSRVRSWASVATSSCARSACFWACVAKEGSSIRPCGTEEMGVRASMVT